MRNRPFFLGATLLSLLAVSPVHATVLSVFTGSDPGAATGSAGSAFLAAAGGGLQFESFETATLANSTTVDFSGGTFSCTGTSYCPGFFGISTSFSDTGSQSVFFASPDTATFTFTSPITEFGIIIGGAGDVAANTMTATLSNGDSALALNNYTGPFCVFNQAGCGSNSQFFGIIDSSSFTSVTFSPNNSADGIFFDTMYYGSGTTATPEPTSVAFLLAGCAAIGIGRYRRSRTSRA